MLGILVNVMICVRFGFDRRMGYRVARGPFLHAAIGFQTRPYKSASTTVLHVIFHQEKENFTFGPFCGGFIPQSPTMVIRTFLSS